MSAITVPSSFCEERFLQRSNHVGNDVWFRNLYVAYRLRGALDLPALTAALTALARGQESLRSTFSGIPNAIVKTVRGPEDASIDFAVVPMRGATIERVTEAVAEEVHQIIDIERGPTMRGRVFTIDDDDHVLVLIFHHATFDAGSYGILLKELNALYRAAQAGELAAYDHPAFGPTAFGRWQRGLIGTPRHEEVAAYWRGFLPKCTVMSDALPVDAPRGSRPRARGLLPFSIPPELLLRLRARATAQRIPLPTLACTATIALLRRLVGTDDVTLGYVFDMRSRYALVHRNEKTSFERVFGNFITLLPICVPLSATTTGGELLASVHTMLRDHTLHSDLPPFDFAVDSPDGRRTPRRCDVAFNYHRTRAELALPGVSSAERLRREGIEKSSMWKPHFDLEWRIVESGTNLSGLLVYDEALFNRESAEQYSRSYVDVLGKLADSADACLW